MGEPRLEVPTVGPRFVVLLAEPPCARRMAEPRRFVVHMAELRRFVAHMVVPRRFVGHTAE